MKLDINKLLDKNYLNTIISQLNKELEKLRTGFIDLYSFDDLKKLKIDEINSIFTKYGVDNSSFIRYLESDFIDKEWEFADLFADDLSYSEELQETFKNSAIREVELLNEKISEINAQIKKDIESIETNLEVVNQLLRILDDNIAVSEKDIIWLLDLVYSNDSSLDEIYEFSGTVARLLIAKNKELLIKKTDVDTVSFEDALEEIYESSSVDDSLDDVIETTTYSETIIGYYKFYKDLFESVGLGSNLEEVMTISEDLDLEIDSNLHSLDRELFGIGLGSSFVKIHRIDGKDKKSQDEKARILVDLGILDKLYEADEKILGQKEQLLAKITEDLKIIYTMPLDILNNPFVKKIVNILRVLKDELSKKLMDEYEMKVMFEKYDKINSDINKIPLILKQLEILSGLNEQIANLLNSDYETLSNLSEEDYINLSRIKNDILNMIELVKKGSYNPEYDETCRELLNSLKKFIKEKPLEATDTYKLNGFVLFDIDERYTPYVINDMDVNSKSSLIDKGILKNKLNAGYTDFSHLIRDLLFYGVPEALRSPESNPYVDKILDCIYYDDSRNHPTGMVRIRPLKSSLLRFSSKEIVLKPSTEIFRQVTSLIKMSLPNVEINFEQEFKLFINFSSALKLADKDSYSETIHRFDRRSPLYKLFFLPPDKTKLTDDEYSLLKDFITISLDVYGKLEKKNENLKFDFIHQMGGIRSHGQ